MDIHYLGDTARVPYGSRSQETVIRYSLDCAGFLVKNFNIDTIVIACNTASSYAVEPIKDKFGINVIGVVKPGAKKAVEVTKNGKVGVIGTRATVRSNSYVDALKAIRPDLHISQTPCPLFVPIVEEMLVNTEIARNVIKYYLEDLIASGIDTLILGCTHYPLLAGTISEIYPEVQIVDSSEAIIEDISKLNIKISNSGKREIYLTDESPAFECLKKVLTNGCDSKKVEL
jgi:glutamate racemase